MVPLIRVEGSGTALTGCRIFTVRESAVPAVALPHVQVYVPGTNPRLLRLPE
jgi:hypothetical protein